MPYRGSEHYFEKWRKELMGIRTSWRYMAMRWKVIVALAASLAALIWLNYGCATINLPSVCDQAQPGDSFLCDAAKAMGVNLEFTGEVFSALNAEAIISGEYTQAQALDGIAELRRLGSLASGDIDVAVLGQRTTKMISNHPLLMFGSRTVILYLKYNGAGRFFSVIDQAYWEYWCDSLEEDVKALNL
jgi:hypothetical protein